MKLPFTGLSNIQKFFIYLSLVFIFALGDLHLFTRKAAKVELYDDLASRISTVRVSIIKLEYMLDMLVVARRFESTSIELIKGDVDELDGNITGIVGDEKYRPLLDSNTLVAEGLNSIGEDWHNIKIEIGRLNDALDQDAIMLLHNAVDIHTVLVIEKADRLLSAISESRQTIFGEIKNLELKSVIAFVLIALFVSLAYYKRIVSPLGRITSTARMVSGGDTGARFADDRKSLAGRLGGELNSMLDGLGRENAALVRRNSELEEALAADRLKMSSFSTLMVFAASSLSQNDVLGVALDEAVAGAGAKAGAVFISEGGEFRRKASTGFGAQAPGELLTVSKAAVEDTRAGGKARVYSDVAGFPDSSIGEFLGSRRFESLLSLPISYNKETLGLMLVAYAGEVADPVPGAPFLEAMASGAAVAIGHVGLFQGEHSARRFVERLVHQMPFGLAVFDKEGCCRMMNVALKKMLGAQKADMPGGYSIFEDQVFAAQGMLSTIKKAYEGYSTEFIINYDPADVTRYGFSGPQKKLKIRSFPLYDAGGDISNIVLLYEDLTDLPGVPAGSGDAL